MNISQKEINEWYCKYNIDNEPENKYEKEILKNIRIGEIKTWEDFKSLLFKKKGILYWKGASRTKPYYICLDSDTSKWQKLFEIIKRSKDEPRNTVKNIVNFSGQNMSYNGKNGGISYPVASTLVYFFSEGDCPVIDWRAIYTLQKTEYGEQIKMIKLYTNKNGTHQIYLDDEGWERYFDLCENLVKNLGIEKIGGDTPLRVLDKALWEYPDLNKAERKKEVCC